MSEGRGRWTVNGAEFEAGAGGILVIKAGETHSFRCIGDAPLVQLEGHLSPRFIPENLTWCMRATFSLDAPEVQRRVSKPRERSPESP